MKISRNDQCPCGSGKKYKKCCLPKAEAQDFAYRRISQTFQGLTGKIMTFAENAFGQTTIEAAVEEFLVWDEDFEATIEIEELADLFVPWALYTWYMTEADLEDMELKIPLPADTTIAELYIQKKGKKIDSLELKILQAINRPVFSFQEVTGILPGSGFSCTNILTGQTHNVTDRSSSEILEIGDIFFCAISRVDDIEMLVGASPIKFPLSWKTDVIDLRTFIKKDHSKLTAEDEHDNDAQIRDLFLALYAAAFNPPALTNTDGDPLALHTLHYSIPSAREAFDALCHLSAPESKESLLEDAAFAESGELASVTIPWMRQETAKAEPSPSTVLGNIQIDEDTMTIDVNSEKRAQAIRDIITAAMGDKAQFKTAILKSLNAPPEDEADRDDDLPAPHETAMQDPVIREHLEKMYFEHWKKWVDDAIPALGGETPREAVKNPDGREKVETLLRGAELNLSPDSDFRKKGIEHAKKELGLS